MAVLGLCCCTQAFSNCKEWRLLSSCSMRASHCGGFSCCRAWALTHVGSVVVLHWPSCPMACGDLPGPGIEPVLSALAGRFLTNGPPGSPAAAAAAAAVKSLQLCPTLCNPMDGSPPGSAVPGILQARILEWVTISFSNA